MRKIFFIIGICFLTGFKSFGQTAFVIDHRHTDLSKIPNNWIDSAQKKLKIVYFRMSHGKQVDYGGMTALKNFSSQYADKYKFSSSPAVESLLLVSFEKCIDCNPSTIYSDARAFLDDPQNADFNVLMFAWSYDFYKYNLQTYLDSMENFIRDYSENGLYIQSGKRTTPVTFVFQTGCSLGDDLRNKAVFDKNNLIRQYCAANNRILFDFNDIESYNPDGQYFGDGNGSPTASYLGTKRLNDDISYLINGQRTGNWGIEWVSANPNHELSKLSSGQFCSCPHSDGWNQLSDDSRLHCVLKGCAAWWLFASLAGWPEGIATSNTFEPNEQIELNQYPNPFSDGSFIEYKLDEFCEVKLEIWNSSGQKVQKLVNQKQHAGKYKVPISLSESKGLYFYTLEINGKRITRKMIKL